MKSSSLILCFAAFVICTVLPNNDGIGDVAASNFTTSCDNGVACMKYKAKSDTELTATIADNSILKREDHTLQVVIGSDPQHTGLTRGPRLYDQIYQALVTQCPGGGNIVECLRKGAAPPIGVDGLTSNRNTNVVYVKVEVIDSFWGQRNDALRLLMIGTVAAIVQASADTESNCEAKRNNGRPLSYYCNVPNWISVKPPIESGNSWARLDVRIISDHTRTKYDCQGFLTPANKAVDPLLQEYSKVTSKSVDRNLWCLSHTKRSSDIATTLTGSSVATRSDSTLSIVLGTGSQQSGHVRGNYLYHMVYEALSRLCPEHGTSDARGKCWKYTTYFQINAMNGATKVPSTVGVSVDGSSHWGGKNNALRLLMIGTIAGVIEQASLIEDKNCRKIGEEFYCNIPDFVSIKPPVSDGTSLKVHFRNGFEMDQPRFDCAGLLTPANSQADKYLPEYQIALRKTNMDRNVWCAKKDDDKRDTGHIESSTQARNNPVLTVEFGVRPTNLGKLRGSPLYGKIMDVIKLQCPQERGNCDHGVPSSFDVDAMASNTRKGRVQVTIEVLQAYWGDSSELWALMIGTIAGAQEQASLNPSNCKKKTEYCNIANFVSVIVPPKKGSPFGTPTTKMDVLFTSKYQMKKTSFDCKGLLTPVNTIVDTLMPGFKKYAGIDFERNVRCQGRESGVTDVESAI